jgi:glutathione synthase/RimK-type ligase-like ATP-grasp enzyme
VGGEPVVVFVKRRPKDQRFANFNTSVQLADPAKVFTAAEREKIAAFAAAMNLDWGGLDVLRDRESGRIYIVDVNKTDMPPLALSFTAKVRSTRLMGMALERLIKRMRGRHALR